MIDLIMYCITVSLTMLINEKLNAFHLERFIRTGGPIPPYIFLYVRNIWVDIFILWYNLKILEKGINN